MRWTRIRQIYNVTGAAPWARSHATMPVPVHLGEDVFRIYFSTRDDEKRSSIAWIDARINDDPTVIGQCDAPVLRPGADGTFDDSGVTISSIVRTSDGDRLYYMGWNLSVRAPWRNSIGLALGDARSGRFERYSVGPIMDRSPADPYTLNYPWVIADGAGGWRMWYGSTLAWGSRLDEMLNAVKHATSADGVIWRTDGAPVLVPQDDEIAVSRPCVLPAAPGFEMWFAHRGTTGYRLGHATSPDGMTWTRSPPGGLPPASEGWDSEMICYPTVFDHAGRRWMLYNGNSYGLTGFGLARLDPD